MKAISIGTDRKLFEENSAVRRRQIEYGRFFDELHIVVFSKRNFKYLNSKYQISKNVFVYSTNSKNKLFYVIDAFLIIKKLIGNWKLEIGNSRNYVIVSCQDPFETGIVGAFVKMSFGLPLHIQVHTDLAHKYFRQSSLLNKIRFMMAEFVLKYSDGVRVVSERIKDFILNFSKNIDVLPIKIKLKEGNKERLKDWGEIKNILTVCRLEKEKNLETAIIAFKIVSEKFPEAIFTIVGDGGERKNLEKLSSDLGLQNKVIFTGWQNDLEKYYNDASVYVSTSLYEGYGLSVVEAASYGLPLILSDTGLANDVFKGGESALICDAKDTECFAKNILKVCEDKNLAQRLGLATKIAVQAHFEVSKNYLEKYANSVKSACKDFKKRNFILRLISFKIIFWSSFIYLRYFVCGITAAAVNIGSLYIFTDTFGVWYLYSSVLAFFISLVVSFILQKFVVFKDSKLQKIHSQFSKFSVAAIFGVMTNTFLVYVCVDVFGVWYIFSQIVAGFFVMIQNFIIYKFFIFKK